MIYTYSFSWLSVVPICETIETAAVHPLVDSFFIQIMKTDPVGCVLEFFFGNRIYKEFSDTASRITEISKTKRFQEILLKTINLFTKLRCFALAES